MSIALLLLLSTNSFAEYKFSPHTGKLDYYESITTGGGLLATGATTGATSQAQAFTNGVNIGSPPTPSAVLHIAGDGIADGFKMTFAPSFAGIAQQTATGTVIAPTIVTDGQVIGGQGTQGYDGEKYVPTADFLWYVEGTPDVDIIPTKLVFTTTDTSGVNSERMIIHNNGDVTLNGVLSATSPVFTTPNIGSATGDISGNAGTVTDGVYTTGAGTVYVTPTGSETLTNKRISPRVVTTADDATAVIDTDVTDVYELTAVANATVFTLTGTPTAGQKLIVKFKDAGVAKGLTWTGFTAVGVTLPTTTVAGKQHYVGCIYNLPLTRWEAIAVGQES